MSTLRAKERALEKLRREAEQSSDCPLKEGATQIVFGAGPADARVMLIGEAPATHEDAAGVPFVGPAGRVLDKALEKARLNRDELYVTNVEKFKHRRKGGKNLPPRSIELEACRPWLEQEIAIVQPEIIGCLGATASKWILGKSFGLLKQRGEWLTSEHAPHVLATIHPSYILSQRDDEARERWEQILIADLRKIARKCRRGGLGETSPSAGVPGARPPAGEAGVPQATLQLTS